MGDLTIRILEASNLIPADRNGKSDPYVTVEILEDPMQKKQKTHCHHKTLNPVWHETFKFRSPAPNSTILFKVWDRDLFSRNDPLGNFNVSVNRLSPNVPNNMWLDLQGVPHGKLHVEIIFVPSGGVQTMGAQQGYGQGYPTQQPYPNNYAPTPTQSYQPNAGQRGPTGTFSSVPTNTGYPSNPTMSSGYAQPPTSSGYAPPPPTSSGYVPPPTSSGYAPPPTSSGYPPNSSYSANPTASMPRQPLSVVESDDVGVDYSKMASDFSMSGYQQPPPSNYQQQPYSSQPNYPPQQSSYPPPQSGYPPQISTQQGGYPPQQSGYPPQSSYPPQQQGGYPPQQTGYPPQQSSYPPQQAGGYPQQGGYGQPSNYSQAGYGATPMVTAQGLVAGPKLTKFFVDIKKKLNRDYIVIMDMSGSMGGGRWEQAKDATMKIAPFACQADPDGITLYLFNGRFSKFEHLTNGGQVQAIFSREKPSGTTNLSGVLHAAFNEHFSGNKPTTILVITDGEPDSQAATTKEIVQAASRINSQEDLSVSFIQIGNDSSATKFLQYLDNNLQSQGARFDIVDTVSAADIGTMSFEQLIQKSIYD